MAVSISLSIKQESQDIANNLSNVTVVVTARWNGGSHNVTGECTGTIKIDGEEFSFDGITFNPGMTETGSQVIMTQNADVYHEENGKKNLICSANFNSGVSSGTVSTSAMIALDTIPKTSTLTIESGTLGVAQTITIETSCAGLTHSIVCWCGDSVVLSICDKTYATTIEWTPPLDWAAQNTTGTSVTAEFIMQTWSNGEFIGAVTENISFDIPSEIRPTFTVDFTDATGVKDTYGSFYQNLSQLNVKVNASSPYGATIDSCKITANGETFLDFEATTNIVKYFGDIQVRVEVTDSRNRNKSEYFYVRFEPYRFPSASTLTVKRCDSDGKANDQGEYVQVKFSALTMEITGNNTTVTLEYKKSTEDSYDILKTVKLTDEWYLSDSCIFAADTGSSYNVLLTVSDNFYTVTKATVASTAAVIMHFKANGKGIGLGKVAETDNAVDVGWKINMNGNRISALADPEDDQDAVTKAYLLRLLHPVGSVYFSTESDSPEDLFGGAWEEINDLSLSTDETVTIYAWKRIE